MIDGKTLFDWWEESWPDAPRWGWDNQLSVVQRAFNALAERIKAEMGRPLIIEEGAIQVNLSDLAKPGFATLAEEPRIEGLQKIEFRPDEFAEIKLVASASSNEYSTHHKSCALRHDGITCTCP